MGKDLLNDKYGRFYEIPAELARKGHKVTGLCLSYRYRDEILYDGGPPSPNTPAWYSVNLGIAAPIGILRYLRELDKIVDSIKPDVICGCSDAYHAIFARRAAKRHNIPLVIDLYDNFESYGATRVPGVRSGLARSLKMADGISVVSEPLRQHIIDQHGLTQPIIVLGNAIKGELFSPRDQANCRKRLGLPDDRILIGTAGALHRNRDIQTLYNAFEELRSDNNGIHLVLAGPRGKSAKMPTGEDVHDLGMLAHSDVAIMSSALDLGIICNTNSEFGRYCYPQKFFEILACRTPVIAAAVGALQEMLAPYGWALYQPGEPMSLASGIRELLANPRMPDLPIPDWETRASELESLLLGINDERAR